MGHRPLLVTLLLALGSATQLFSGTVITNNLPANTAIINIDATRDGSATFNGDQSLWYQPFNSATPPQLVEYAVPPGAYAFRVINPADAAALFPALTADQSNQIYTAWTYNSPWITDYLVFESSAATNSSVPQLFDGAPGPGFPNPNAAYQDAVSAGYAGQIRVGPNGRDSKVLTNSFAFRAPTTLIFAVPDYGLFDNGGGVSVLVSLAASPLLRIIPGLGTVNLQWTTTAAGFNLEQSLAVTGMPWNTVTNTPTVVGGEFAVTVPDSPVSLFFRLRHP